MGGVAEAAGDSGTGKAAERADHGDDGDTTGGSLAAAISFLVDRGADDITAICLLAAPEGCANLERGLAEAEWYQCPVPRATMRQ